MGDLSAATSFEIAVKHSLGKLVLREPPETFLHNRIFANALTPFPITIEYCLPLAKLPFHHRDPFDRLLVAQALSENLPLLSADDSVIRLCAANAMLAQHSPQEWRT